MHTILVNQDHRSKEQGAATPLVPTRPAAPRWRQVDGDILVEWSCENAIDYELLLGEDETAPQWAVPIYQGRGTDQYRLPSPAFSRPRYVFLRAHNEWGSSDYSAPSASLPPTISGSTKRGMAASASGAAASSESRRSAASSGSRTGAVPGAPAGDSVPH